MHLLTFLEMKKPGLMFRAAVMGAQGVFLGAYTLSYILSSRSCHRFVGYLEEEAVKTYTRAIDDLDSGKLPAWENLPAPEIGVDYWKLKDGALIRDLLLAIRADEAVHRYVNHTFGSLKVTDPVSYFICYCFCCVIIYIFFFRTLLKLVLSSMTSVTISHNLNSGLYYSQ
jgi:hypothetical protein